MKPASRNGVPVLSVLYGLLFLLLLALAGWLYWSDLNDDKTSSSIAFTDITPPEPVEKDRQETQQSIPPKQALADNDDPTRNEVKPSLPEIPEKEITVSSEQDPPARPEKQIESAKPAEHSEQIAEISPKRAVSPDQDLPGQKEETPAVTDPQLDLETPTTAVNPPPSEGSDTASIEKEPTGTNALPVSPNEEAPGAAKKEPQVRITALPESSDPLSPVPDPELAKNSDFGLLPIIGPSGRQPWRIYARPFDDPLDRPRIAIIISEMGMSTSATKSAIQNLQGAVTLSFNPYARDLQSWIEQARAAGHEVLLQLPMEPFGYPQNDPGPHSLLTSLTDRENINRLDWMLGRFTGYSGVTNQMGSKFTAKAEYISPVLDVIKTRGLLFLDGRTSSKSVAGRIASETGIPIVINNRFLDHKADRTTIDARLKDLERIARYTGTAVGIGYPYPVTLERINIWAQTLARKGYVLVPVSAAINRQEIQ